MERVLLKELNAVNMTTRKEILIFLKKLWNGERVNCPVCGCPLEILHKKAKKSNNDWQCKTCGKIYKTLYLLDELNERT